ncbi:MAG: DUF3883 domain-containing protein [Pyrinomonadaceae bacterium]
MNLPETTMLNFFNRMLISLLELTSDGSNCSVESLISQCKSVVFGGQRVEHYSVLEHCKFCGLIQIKDDHISLSVLGQKFLDANINRYFELTEAQKQLIVERIVFKGVWNHYARDLFSNFSLNQISGTYEISTDEISLSKEQNIVIHFFKYIGLLKQVKSIVQVENQYSELVYQLTADSKVLSEQQLEKILMENRKLGAQAENAVVEFEKQRLRKLGKEVQAELVKRISTTNVSAGYDIESFDGITDEIFPNRFIEVKATTSDEIRFYWSHNEIKVASVKKDKYWIYMMKGFREDKPSETYPIMIQNPESAINDHAFLTMEAYKFLIKEISEVALTRYNLDEIIWYQIT